MPLPSGPEANGSTGASRVLPALTRDKDRALGDALTRFVPRRQLELATESRSVADRPDLSVLTEAPADLHVTAVRRIPPLQAAHAPFPETLDPRLIGAFGRRGIAQLYAHQAEAIGHVLAGRHVVVVTPTASGKTLCYNAPVLDAILRDPSTRALYLFPTKALAQDQLAELHDLAELLADDEAAPIGVFTYDGDTPQDARRAIRGRAHVVLSNPDMLHAGILPHHPRWAKLFENLRFVIIDELHAYRGVFGSHLTNILRRLQRVCRHYGSSPIFICSSATIANPRDLAERLTEQPFEIVERSGAPRGEKFFVFVNPPVVNRQLGIRRSYLAETRRVALEFLQRNLQLIVFAQSRLATEILTTYLKDAFKGPPGAADVVRGYRGGYLPLRRREIERGLREGTVRAVVSTSALELGIDIGALDVSLLAGYPGTIAATWQRAGRAGRRASRSAAVLVASSAPLDQFVVRHPSYFFDASPEHALVNPDNLHILLAHVKCAAFELPFTRGESFGGEDVQQILALLEEEGFVHLAEGQWNWTNESYPADAVSLRSVSSDNFVVVDETNGPRVIGETDYTSAPSTLHEKAIYIVEGQLYQVERLDFEGRKAYVRAVDCDYYTDAISYTRVTILDEFARDGSGAGDFAPAGPGGAAFPMDGRLPAANLEVDDLPGMRVTSRTAGAGDGAGPPVGRAGGVHSHGEVHVVSRVVGFKKIRFYTNENVGSGELDLPEQQMHTSSYWLSIPREIVGTLPYGNEDRRDGVSGLANAMRIVAQLLLMCDRNDLGLSVDAGDPPGREWSAERPGAVGRIRPTAAPARPGDVALGREATPAHEPPFEPRVFVYDNYPGGIGFSEPLHGMHDLLMSETRALIAGCACESGCPSCVGPAGEAGPRAKEVALALLERLLPGPSTGDGP